MAQNLGNLPVGALVKDATSLFLGKPVIWKVADKNHTGYPSNSVTLISERMLAGRCFDAMEANNADNNRRSYGNNRYIHSNIDQWLNSDAAAGKWYTAQHSADAPPTAANVWVTSNVRVNPYDTDAGFLNAFSAQFKAALLTTTLTVAKNTVTDGGGSETLARKLFLPSTTEVGLANENNIAEGTRLALFTTDNASRVCYMTTEGLAANNDPGKPANNNTAWHWWLRTPYASYSCYARVVHTSGALSDNNAYVGRFGARPLCNLSSSILVSDTTDGDGCYTITWNQPPTQPPSITVPDAIYSGRTARIEWGASTDPDNDPITYLLERSSNNGAYTQIYSGAARTFDDTITTAMNTLLYRVKARDTFGNESAYRTSASKAVIHNMPPAISGVDGSLGIKTGAFSYKYTITDEDGDAVSVVEAVDGRTIKQHTVTLGAENSMEVAGNDWVRLGQGNHTLTVKATDTEGGTTTRTMTFTKNAQFLSFELLPEEIKEFEMRPERITINATREVPAGALFTVEVTNNAFDANPTWEDATASAVAGLAYVFQNEVKATATWGVSIRAKIERNGAVGNCRIYGVGGNIE